MSIALISIGVLCCVPAVKGLIFSWISPVDKRASIPKPPDLSTAKHYQQIVTALNSKLAILQSKFRQEQQISAGLRKEIDEAYKEIDKANAAELKTVTVYKEDLNPDMKQWIDQIVHFYTIKRHSLTETEANDTLAEIIHKAPKT